VFEIAKQIATAASCVKEVQKEHSRMVKYRQQKLI
jgi:hypothetical protein